MTDSDANHNDPSLATDTDAPNDAEDEVKLRSRDQRLALPVWSANKHCFAGLPNRRLHHLKGFLQLMSAFMLEILISNQGLYLWVVILERNLIFV